MMMMVMMVMMRRHEEEGREKTAIPSASSASPPMELLREYGGEDSGEDAGVSVPAVVAAPEVVVSHSDVNPHFAFHDAACSSLSFNPTFEAISAPVEGPVQPESLMGLESMPASQKNVWTGHVEETNLNDYVFAHNYYAHTAKGVAPDPQGYGDVVDSTMENRGEGPGTGRVSVRRKRKLPEGSKDPASDNFVGPWGRRDEVVTEVPTEMTEEHKAFLERVKGGEEKAAEAPKEKTIFHGKEERDYLGRTYIVPPSYLVSREHTCRPPTKQVHTWSGHSKGVSAIRWFPTYGHLLLSSGLDSKIKIWDVFNDRKVLRTYLGHTRGVRDVCFDHDGKRFLSCGNDRQIKLWDTETGACLGSFSNGKQAYCVKFNPDEDKKNMFVAGMSDRKVIQWNIDTGETCQEYDRHLASVNTITFIDNNQRFVTTSDDKTIRIWDWEIPVDIKYIAEPHMQSMPSVCVHPSGKWFLTQSMDNQILIYSTRERFRQNKKKRFIGHSCAGYGCQVNMSPDGKYVISGDANGKVWFWEWRRSRPIQHFNAHERVCKGVEWHPIEASWVATCGWDGAVRLFN